MNSSKRHIIIVASKLFLEKCYKEVTMQEIVKVTGLSKGAFYHHFKSKEELFLEVIVFFFQSLTRDFNDYSKNSLKEFYEQYLNDSVTLAKNYLGNFDYGDSENTLTLNYFSLMFDALKLFPEFRARAIDAFNLEIDQWTLAVERARASGEIKSPMSDRQIAEMFMYLSDGIGMHMIMRGADFDTMIVPVKEHWDMLYEQIKA